MSYLFLFFFCLLSVIVFLLPLNCCLRHKSMSVCVCVILCNQPSPNTSPQTYISHFGMMTLPVLAALIMIKLCCRP